MKYQVKFYKGDYIKRQREANQDKAICYIEHHFNTSDSNEINVPDYTVVVTGSNASKKSIEWARWYANAILDTFSEVVKKLGGDGGVLVGGYDGRGDGNLKHTNMPAILVEPLFVNNPEHVKILRSASGISKLAEVLSDSIIKCFPQGGLVAFSIGHKYKDSEPTDLGAGVLGGGWEGDFAELVMQSAQLNLQDI